MYKFEVLVLVLVREVWWWPPSQKIENRHISATDHHKIWHGDASWHVDEHLPCRQLNFFQKCNMVHSRRLNITLRLRKLSCSRSHKL